MLNIKLRALYNTVATSSLNGKEMKVNLLESLPSIEDIKYCKKQLNINYWKAFCWAWNRDNPILQLKHRWYKNILSVIRDSYVGIVPLPFQHPEQYLSPICVDEMFNYIQYAVESGKDTIETLDILRSLFCNIQSDETILGLYTYIIDTIERTEYGAMYAVDILQGMLQHAAITFTRELEVKTFIHYAELSLDY